MTMPRPCGHTVPIPDLCRVCWLSENDPRYTRLWERSTPMRSCIHLGDYTGDTELCSSCRGSVRIKLYSCSVHGQCTLDKQVQGKACCNGFRGPDGFHSPCPDYTVSTPRPVQPQPSPPTPTPSSGKKQVWQYGVTTTPVRVADGLLDRTLDSLQRAGFPLPRLFVDGAEEVSRYKEKYGGCEVTCRNPNVRTHGNWILSLYELYLRNPHANRYAVFQDDLVTYPNLRDYLDSCQYPERGYWNLYTFPENQKICPTNSSGEQQVGWYASNQRGLGAVALVFDREAVIALLTAKHMVERVAHPKRGHKSVDGGIVTAMKNAGYREYVHNPSLVQHTGEKSSMGNKRQPLSPSFRGEIFDCLSLLVRTST